jgi:transcriptional regulator with XRE-family HTH domain
MDLYEVFGNHIRALRAARNWSQEEFADKCGINRSHMGEIERGEVKVNLRTLKKIARGFDMTLSQLLHGVD